MPTLNVEEVDVPAERRRRRIRIAAVTAAGLAIIACMLGASWYFSPPPMPTTIEEAKALVDSPRFARLSKDQRRPYLDVITETFGSLDDDTRRAMVEENDALRDALREGRRSAMMERARAFGLADAEEREAMLAESPWGARPPGPRPGGGDGGARMRGRINDSMVNGNPQQGAYFAEMIRSRRGRPGG